MNSETKIVLFDFPIQRGAEAFAIEDAILEDEGFADKIVLFTWRTKPTIMLGRFQNALREVNLKALQERDVDLVRRATGGGTIYTDDGCFQFSLIAPRTLPNGSYQKEINFERFLKPSREVFLKMGIDCEISERNDLLHKGVKFNGNSQHISKDRILYHGSVLYNTDLGAMAKLLTPQKLKMESKGISSTRQRVVNLIAVDPFQRTVERFQKEFEERFALELACQYVEFAIDAIDRIERVFHLETEKPELFRRAAEIQRLKYDNPDWIVQKEPAYTIEKEGLFEAGFVKALIDVKKGLIASLRLEGDFFSEEAFLEERLKAFEGRAYSADALADPAKALCDGELFQVSYSDLMKLLFD